MDISKAIKDIRLKMLLSQSDFAQELGVSFSTVNRWENGKAIPGYKALKRIKVFCDSNGLKFGADQYIKGE